MNIYHFTSNIVTKKKNFILNYPKDYPKNNQVITQIYQAITLSNT